MGKCRFTHLFTLVQIPNSHSLGLKNVNNSVTGVEEGSRPTAFRWLKISRACDRVRYGPAGCCVWGRGHRSCNNIYDWGLVPGVELYMCTYVSQSWPVVNKILQASNTTTRFSGRSSNFCNFTPRLHQIRSEKVRNLHWGGVVWGHTPDSPDMHATCTLIAYSNSRFQNSRSTPAKQLHVQQCSYGVASFQGFPVWEWG